LQQVLPDFMVPSAWSVLNQLPLTPNGKIDRRALPFPQELGADTTPDDPPHTELECAVAQIWQTVLGVPQVGLHADFFQLGGHSLLATRIISHLREQLDVDLPLRVLFERPTVAALVESVLEHIATEVAAEVA